VSRHPLAVSSPPLAVVTLTLSLVGDTPAPVIGTPLVAGAALPFDRLTLALVGDGLLLVTEPPSLVR
jgi:hypothetical protein